MPFTPLILVHIAAAVGAALVGAIMLAIKRGTPLHRITGRVWVALMLATALVSFGIQASGNFSWIHLLSAWMLVTLFVAVRSILRGNTHAHRRWMISAYAGLVTAGVFALLPDRRLGFLVWHAFGLV